MVQSNSVLRMLHPSSEFANGAFLSLDWATLICQNCTIRQLMHLLKLDKYSRVSFRKEELRIYPGNDAFAFDINGVQFCVNRTIVACYGLDLESNDIFDYQFDEIRVNITGSGLRFLRAEYDQFKLWADQYILYFFTMPDVPKGHFTRLDFALDIVNDYSNILGNIVQHMQYGGKDKFGGSCGGQFTAGSTRPYKTKLWLDPENNGVTAYIGSGASDQMLRIYNKYAECRESVKIGKDKMEVWKPGKAPDFPGIDVSSINTWVRFELVLRNKKAMEYTPVDSESKSVFDHPSFFAKEIRKKFAPVRNSVYVDWWLDFWKPLEDDSKINLNLHFVQLDVSAATKVVNYCATTASVNMLITCMLASPQFVQMYFQKLLLWIQLSNKGDENKSWIKLKQVLTSEGIAIEDLDIAWCDQFNAWIFPGIRALTKEDCHNQYQKQLGSRFGWRWEPDQV